MQWRQAEEQPLAVLSDPRTGPQAGWGLRSCGRRLSGPVHNLRTASGEEEKDTDFNMWIIRSTQDELLKNIFII